MIVCKPRDDIGHKLSGQCQPISRTNYKSTSHHFDISICLNFLTKENVDNKREDEEQCFHEPKAQIYNAPKVTVINKFSLKVEIDIDMHQGSHA